MPSHLKTTKHIIKSFVDWNYLTSLWVSQVPRSPKPAIFGVTTTTDKSAQTDYFTPVHANRVIIYPYPETFCNTYQKNWTSSWYVYVHR